MLEHWQEARRRSHTSRVLALAFLLLAQAPAPAQEPAPVAEQEPVQEPVQEVGQEPEEGEVLEQAHTWLTNRVRTTAEWLDGFFGTERSESERNGTSLRLRSDAQWVEGQGVDFDLRARVRMHLPRTSERLQLFFSGDPNEDLEGDNRSDESPRDAVDEERSDSELGAEYFLLDTLKRNLKVSAGMRFRDSKPVPTFGVRFRRNLEFEDWLVRFTERVRWENEFGWESRTGLDFDRVLGENYFFRSSTELSWYEDLDGVFLRQRFALAQRLSERTVVAWSATSDFHSEPHVELDLVRLRLGWRRAIWERRAYIEIAPEMRYSRTLDFHPEVVLLVRLDLDFGGGFDEGERFTAPEVP